MKFVTSYKPKHTTDTIPTRVNYTLFIFYHPYCKNLLNLNPVFNTLDLYILCKLFS